MLQKSAPILVTGASGYVGRHIVGRLSERGCPVRALVRRTPAESFGDGVEIATGDLNHPETYRPFLDNVLAVVHAGLSGSLSHEPELTSTLFEKSAQAGVRRFIHLSSIAVYGNPLNGIITEETQPLPTSHAYSQAKLAIEKALEAAPGVSTELTILRLGCVYGPGGGWWTDGLLRQMQRGKVILVDQGAGAANLIHVSDVAACAVSVLESDKPVRGVFNVTDGQPVTWARYFDELERIAGRHGIVHMSADQARDYGSKWIRPSLWRRAVRKITGAPLIFPLDDQGVANFTSRAVYSNKKAAAVLQFAPEHGLESGMRTVRDALQADPRS